MHYFTLWTRELWKYKQCLEDNRWVQVDLSMLKSPCNTHNVCRQDRELLIASKYMCWGHQEHSWGVSSGCKLGIMYVFLPACDCCLSACACFSEYLTNVLYFLLPTPSCNIYTYLGIATSFIATIPDWTIIISVSWKFINCCFLLCMQVDLHGAVALNDDMVK